MLSRFRSNRLASKMRAFVLALVALMGAAGLQAHREPEALTTAEYNSNTGQTEIVHRPHIHDVEPNMDRILREAGQSLESLEGRARVAIYVRERFAIIPDGQRAPLLLSLVGAEIEGDYLYVYQEYNGELPDSLRIRDGILRDVFPEQVNRFSIKKGSRRSTLSFKGKDDWKSLVLSSE